MKEITINVPDGKNVEWKEIDGKTVLVMIDEVDERPVTERIKTLEDALRELGTPEDEIPNFFKKYEGLGKDVVAYAKLRVIAEALNEGWKPSFTEDEYRYYPWFYLMTQEEIDSQSEEWKKSHSLWLFGGNSRYGSNCGLASSFSLRAWSFASSCLSARLAMKTEELAKYFGNQFIEIWADYVYWKED